MPWIFSELHFLVGHEAYHPLVLSSRGTKRTMDCRASLAMTTKTAPPFSRHREARSDPSPCLVIARYEANHGLPRFARNDDKTAPPFPVIARYEAIHPPVPVIARYEAIHPPSSRGTKRSIPIPLHREAREAIPTFIAATGWPLVPTLRCAPSHLGPAHRQVPTTSRPRRLRWAGSKSPKRCRR